MRSFSQAFVSATHSLTTSIIKYASYYWTELTFISILEYQSSDVVPTYCNILFVHFIVIIVDLIYGNRTNKLDAIVAIVNSHSQ